MALEDDEVKLIARLSEEVEATTKRFRSQGALVLVGAVVVAMIAAARAIWFLVPIALLFGAGAYALAILATKKSGPARAAPVLEALRVAPEKVRTIAHQETSDSLRLFVGHWVVVTVDGGSLRVRADDWRELIDALRKRCPKARVE